ncbi:hypothetical protein [Hymenobacter sp. CRA2]|uniref:hypothetical protein n=1 Tax=Hymenobacter sp. CRA2 TaxID=1955620 RepID=UPI00098F981F|nr:hypothetical protein [Hymenobacter sp. CRA2]OON70080.1 hypothetical protein B0919_04880 [Hymenobacter sp. CRA2]
MIRQAAGLAATLLMLGATQLRAQTDHLVPAPGYFSSYSYAPDYYARVQQTLLKGLADSPVLRIVVLPSFLPEYVISLEQQGQTYALQCVTARSSVWHALQTKAPAPVIVARHTAAISPAAARAVAAAFNAAIDQTHYPSPTDRRMVMDGVNYHFVSFRGGLGLREGTAHSPARGSNLALLVQLTDGLQQLALQSPDAPKEAELINLAESAAAKFTAAAPATAK